MSFTGWVIGSGSIERIYRANQTSSYLNGKQLFLFMDVFGMAMTVAKGISLKATHPTGHRSWNETERGI